MTALRLRRKRAESGLQISCGRPFSLGQRRSAQQRRTANGSTPVHTLCERARLHGKVPDACSRHQLRELLQEGHEGDGLVVQLWVLERIDCGEHRLLQLLPAVPQPQCSRRVEQRRTGAEQGCTTSQSALWQAKRNQHTSDLHSITQRGAGAEADLVTPTSVVTTLSYTGRTSSGVGLARPAAFSGSSMSLRHGSSSASDKMGKENVCAMSRDAGA
jgi:hypothetical protein